MEEDAGPREVTPSAGSHGCRVDPRETVPLAPPPADVPPTWPAPWPTAHSCRYGAQMGGRLDGSHPARAGKQMETRASERSEPTSLTPRCL